MEAIASSPDHGLVPALDCRCTGSPFEMGLAQGSALAPRIRQLRARLRDLEAFRFAQPFWLPYPFFRCVAEIQAGRALAPALARSDPVMLARLRGIAQGSGLPLRSLCLLNAMEALLGSVRNRTAPAPPGACSAVAIRGKRTASGEPIIARNFDYIPLVQPFFILRESRPADGLRSLEFAVAPQVGAVDGINERGLAITLNYAFATDAGRPDSLVSMLISQALATCSNVNEAIGVIGNRSHWGAGILMLADASGNLASIELSNTRSAVRRPDPGQDHLLFTNVCVCPQTCAVQVPETEVFSGRVPDALRGKPVLKWHADRASRISQLLESFERLGPAELESVLSDHGPSGVPDGASPCVHTDYWRTTATLQWFPAQRKVRVSYSTACQARFSDFSL